MTITRSYNKHTNTTYAYETSYVWSEELQRKVQKKKCIGKFDPQTDEIVPNGRRGRPQGSRNADNMSVEFSAKTDNTCLNAKIRQSIDLIVEKCSEIEHSFACCASALSDMQQKLREIWKDNESH